MQVVEHEQHGAAGAGGREQRDGGVQHAQPLDVGLSRRRLSEAGDALREIREQRKQLAAAAVELDAQLVDGQAAA